MKLLIQNKWNVINKWTIANMIFIKHNWLPVRKKFITIERHRLKMLWMINWPRLKTLWKIEKYRPKLSRMINNSKLKMSRMIKRCRLRMQWVIDRCRLRMQWVIKLLKHMFSKHQVRSKKHRRLLKRMKNRLIYSLKKYRKFKYSPSINWFKQSSHLTKLIKRCRLKAFWFFTKITSKCTAKIWEQVMMINSKWQPKRGDRAI